jgi:hypothetical protein
MVVFSFNFPVLVEFPTAPYYGLMDNLRPKPIIRENKAARRRKLGELMKGLMAQGWSEAAQETRAWLRRRKIEGWGKVVVAGGAIWLGWDTAMCQKRHFALRKKQRRIRSFASANKTTKCNSHRTVSARMICSRTIISTR